MESTSLAGIDWNDILEKTSELATSDPGRARVLSTAPVDSAESAELVLSSILDCKALLRSGPRPFMESLNLFLTWHQRLSKRAVLKTLELKDTRLFCLETLALKEVLSSSPSEWGKSNLQSLMRAEEPLSAIDQIMTPQGEIRTDASETLFRLYNEKTSLVRQIQSTLDKTVKLHEMETLLQDKYVTNREGRWVLPIKSGKQHVFEGIIHASSQTKQTVFMEPQEVIPLNNRLRQVEVEIEEEIERLLTELSEYLSHLVADFERTYDVLLKSDVLFAHAQFSLLIDSNEFEFCKEGLDLVQARHPLLVLKSKSVIANSIKLDDQHRILLLSGPNAGGKTILLKTAGLAAHMARCGLPICAAPGSKMAFFKSIHVAVGDAQSVEANLSTFAGHLKILNAATLLKGGSSLLLIDEICGSTDPEEGSALARSFLEHYSENHILCIVTSHLGPLKLGWDAQMGLINGSLEYDNKTGLPTYQFISGVAGQSLAIQTAKRVGVAEPILNRALEHLSPQSRAFQAGLNEIESMKDELRLALKRTQEAESKAQALQLKLDKSIEDLEKEKEKQIQTAVKKAEEKIHEMIETSKAGDVLRRHEQLQKMKSSLPEVVKATPRTQVDRPAPTNAEEFSRAFPPGTPVFLPMLGRDGVIQGVANSRGEVPVVSDSMRIIVPWNQIKPPQKSSNPTAELVRRSHAVQVGIFDFDRPIDLRGMNAEQAIEELETQLDLATVKGLERVKIIHGHGTEVLKRAVRTHLSRSLYVKSWRSGGPDSGGDGVTWAELKNPEPT